MEIGAGLRHSHGDHAAGGHAFRGGDVGNYCRGICPGSDNDAVAEEFLLLAFGPAYQMQAFEEAEAAE